VDHLQPCVMPVGWAHVAIMALGVVQMIVTAYLGHHVRRNGRRRKASGRQFYD
jgi:hypothetical protein